jgi:hypothetical protein
MFRFLFAYVKRKLFAPGLAPKLYRDGGIVRFT